MRLVELANLDEEVDVVFLDLVGETAQVVVLGLDDDVERDVSGFAVHDAGLVEEGGGADAAAKVLGEERRGLGVKLVVAVWNGSQRHDAIGIYGHGDELRGGGAIVSGRG